MRTSPSLSLLASFISLLLVGCTAPGDRAPHSVPLRFVPGSTPTSPMESSDGAAWTTLHPFPQTNSDSLAVQAWAGIGDKFPVGDEDGRTLFEVKLKEGDDDQVSVEIISVESPQIIQIQRDEPVQVHVAGAEYKIVYPTTYVSAKESRRTTNKAMLIVSTKRH